MKIICIGRNYVEHALELKNEVPTEPVFFLKPDTALLPKDQSFYLPEFSKDIHHEIELVLRVCKPGKHIAVEFAERYIDQITVGIDFTARDIQQKQKEKVKEAKSLALSLIPKDLDSYTKIFKESLEKTIK